MSVSNEPAAPPPKKDRALLWILLIVLGVGVINLLLVGGGMVAFLYFARYTEVVRATDEAKQSSLQSTLQTVRSQLELYKIQHNDAYPTDLEKQLFLHTDMQGNTSAVKDAKHPYGPYMAVMPENPVSGSKAIRMVTGADTRFAPPLQNGGWYYNSTTGEFRPDLPDGLAAPDGAAYNAL
jgi:type II secretory pathway pseudopilin PulG